MDPDTEGTLGKKKGDPLTVFRHQLSIWTSCLCL